MPEEKRGTCGFVRRVLARSQRANSVPKKNHPETGRSVDPAKVGGLHQVAWRLVVESFDASWFRVFEVFEEHGSSKSSSHEVILTVGCEEDMWQRIRKIERKRFK
jgi:hypothetical protein